MPQYGDLFTAQAPFFPIFLMAIISYRPEDRKVGREWFELVVSSSSGRSVSFTNDDSIFLCD
jgi:hypothetical protein